MTITHDALDLIVQAMWPQPNPGLAPPPDIDLTGQGPLTPWTWDLTGQGPPHDPGPAPLPLGKDLTGQGTSLLVTSGV